MPYYHVKHETVNVGGTDYLIYSLLNLQQYSDPKAKQNSPVFHQPAGRYSGIYSHRLGFSSWQCIPLNWWGNAYWKSVPASLWQAWVIHRRAEDMTVREWHPLSQTFLNENLLLNKLGPLKCLPGNWEGSNPERVQFDLIIGSDVLYERQQPSQLAAFIHLYAAPSAQVIIVDPNRGNRVGFCREMAGLGYGFTTQRADSFIENGDPLKGGFLTFKRSLELEQL